VRRQSAAGVGCDIHGLSGALILEEGTSGYGCVSGASVCRVCVGDAHGLPGALASKERAGVLGASDCVQVFADFRPNGRRLGL